VNVQLFAPLSRPEEVEPLVGGGATELYCGVYDEGWARRWGLGAWPNRRGPGPGNLGSLDELAEAGRAAHHHGVPLYLVLNAPLLDPEQEDALVRLARHAAHDHGVAGIIVGHPGLLRRLADEGTMGRLVASTLCTARNTDAVRLLVELGATRVILSRQSTVAEIRDIRARVADVELEAFVLADACAFEEGCCMSAHALPGCAGVYCLAERRGEPLDTPAATVHRDWLRALGEQGYSAGGLPLGPCGLCALPALTDAGVDAVKVVGREAHPYRKLRLVQMVRHVLDGLREGGRPEARRRAVALREDPAGCAGGRHCYYPEERLR